MSATVGATSTTPAASSADLPTPARRGRRRGLHLLGIRHHGPGSARSVVRALDALHPTSCSSRRRPTPTTRCVGSATPTWCRPWRSSATSSPNPNGPCSPRSPGSAPSGRRCAGRSSTAWPSRRSTSRSPSRSPAATTGRRRCGAVAVRPSTRSAIWPPPPANRTPSGGGRTSSSTAATASRCSTPWARRWRRCARGRRRRRSTPGGRRTCAVGCGPRWRRAAPSPSCAGRGTCRRSTRPSPRTRPTPPPCGAGPR